MLLNDCKIPVERPRHTRACGYRVGCSLLTLDWVWPTSASAWAAWSVRSVSEQRWCSGESLDPEPAICDRWSCLRCRPKRSHWNWLTSPLKQTLMRYSS